MGAGRRREEEKLCPLCIEVLDADENTHFPCPCGYQVCVFCLDRLKKEYGNRCPGCRTEYGSKVSPFAKRAPSSGDVATSTSGVHPTSSPAVAPAAAVPQPPAPSAGLTPLEQARHMHRAAQQAKRQAAAVQNAAQAAAPQKQAVSQPAPQPQQQQQQQLLQQKQRHQQARTAALQPQQMAQQPVLSRHDAVVQPPPSLAISPVGWASRQQPVGSNSYDASAALDTCTLQPEWLGLGSRSASSSIGNGGGTPNGIVCSSGNSSPWGNGPAIQASGGQQQVSTGMARRTAVPLRPLPLEGGPVAAADPGAEADLARARLAVQCGQLSASDAAWNLLTARTSLHTA